MDVTQITASVRYSADLSKWGGGWKTVELGAEATPSPDRSWKEQQAELYIGLSEQLRALFVRANKE